MASGKKARSAEFNLLYRRIYSASVRRDSGVREPFTPHLAGMARCAVPARIQRAERMLVDVRITLYVAPLNAARTAQRDVPTRRYENVLQSGSHLAQITESETWRTVRFIR
jgi:hypothetical protein